MLKRRTEKKIVVVTRETRVQKLKKRFNTKAQVEFYVKSRGDDFSDYEREDDIYRHAARAAEDILQEWGRVHIIDRAFLPNFLFGPEDTVVAIGQDGLVANTLKYLLEGQPIIGVNPDPSRWDGVLLPFHISDLSQIIGEVLARRHKQQSVTMAKATLNDGQELLAVNDFFIGQRTHQSARYQIEIAGQSERHSSSGVIISTPLGSTGWLKSLLHGATRIAGIATGHQFPVVDHSVPWSTQHLYFTVREPFPSRATQADLVFGKVSKKHPLTIRSQMPENGVLFSDGIEQDFIDFNSGASATITLANTSGNVVVAG